jgi:hypothetical protein
MTEKSNQQSDSRQFEPGEKVRTEFGELRTVWEQRGNQVFVVEEPDNACGQTNPDCYRVRRSSRYHCTCILQVLSSPACQ